MDRKKEILIVLLLFIFAFFLFTWQIGSIPILDGDTAYSATIAKNMLQSGDWMTLKYQDSGEIIPKPPLFYWIIAAGFKIFGINEFGLSIFHSLLAALTILLTYLVTRELFNKRIALWSSLILLTSAQFFYQARSPLQDVPLTLFITAAFYCFILFEKRKNYIFYYLIPIFAALAVLTKGPIGLVLIGLVLLIYAIITKKFFSYINFHLILALILFLLVVSPWFIAEYKILGPDFAKVFWKTNVGRFFMPTDQIGKDLSAPTKPQYDFYTYIAQLFILFLPWSGFLYPAIFYNFKREKVLIGWVLGIIIFFSLSLNYKIGRYILPAYPALAMLVAKFLDDALNNYDSLKKHLAVSKWILTLFILPFMLAATIYFIKVFPSEQALYQGIVLPSLTILFLGLIISTIFLFRKQLKYAIVGFATTAIITYLVLIPSLDIYFKKANPIKEYCLTLNHIIKPGNHVVLYDAIPSSPFAAFYLEHKFLNTQNHQALLEKLKSRQRTYVISENPKVISRLEKIAGIKLKIISQNPNFVLFSNQ
ncbi:MAG: glycosyltransferase family 39 protein [Candidatus Margulisbacteria bacterium]|nr:glycosyltransferase family 39 protein [Candidatus Margulisiibacteriota bacterium]MBU1022223.1 glycosyltransferase family 39 protein [Candidatus Margulisiibacteriota bacterium]MBU1729338.1 glycosyltransferase family 39 protein [Candidatus Margulisiibacteriota bacterium]MBU1955611.1 glycosyltransferase family 39 protein [Candidatus Margulisiibacteriota bacterium]